MKISFQQIDIKIIFKNNIIICGRSSIDITLLLVEIIKGWVQGRRSVNGFFLILANSSSHLKSIHITQDHHGFMECSRRYKLLVSRFSMNWTWFGRIIHHNKTVHIWVEVRVVWQCRKTPQLHMKQLPMANSTKRSHLNINNGSINQIHHLIVVTYGMRSVCNSIPSIFHGSSI